jgi:hypothetical protein
MGLRPEEVDAGWIFTCVRTAGIDVTLDLESGLEQRPRGLMPF